MSFHCATPAPVYQWCPRHESAPRHRQSMHHHAVPSGGVGRRFQPLRARNDARRERRPAPHWMLRASNPSPRLSHKECAGKRMLCRASEHNSDSGNSSHSSSFPGSRLPTHRALDLALFDGGGSGRGRAHRNRTPARPPLVRGTDLATEPALARSPPGILTLRGPRPRGLAQPVSLSGQAHSRRGFN